ncbi:MAG: gas vesicle protein GvpN [Drouetiella hepatica Uher 2000/2452]|uniref:Gas vesicle protein GvpN n=1 Tax=Drouetiella hepatica Uher 2000/2452 TaxID=904376 RepID=A0A951URH2_9CYAN|nr:gas vesicle protein GvpN [Drouetiella hepatica Uher 2000/2452]
MTTVLKTSPRQFVSTPAVERVALRAFRYLQSGYSVHLRGAAGTGKTTLALHLADLMARPIMLIFGDDEFKTSDLIGNQTGYTRKKVVDNYIHSVVKVEDEMRQHWVDSRLTLACREGFTLVYDEFNRSRPEVNNVLLSALEEKLLALPPNNNRSEYVRVSPHFRAVFTSNPEEYCGVHATQDALLDRLVTINMPEPDELTQQEIAVHKTQIDRESALMIIRLVKAFRTGTGNEKASGLRSALMLSKICVEHEILVMPENTEFREVCQDILLSRSGLSIEESTRILWHIFNEMIQADAMQSHSSQSLGHQSLGHSVPDAIASAHLSNREIAYPESFVPAASIDYAPQSRVISRGADEAAEFGLTAIADSPDSEDFELPTEGLELGSVANISVENFPQQSSGSAFSISHKSLKK